MDKDKLTEDVSLNLRSVTQSVKGGILINRLQEDYRQLIGTVIPFQSLGYRTLEQFLQDIPHVVQLKRKPDGNIYVEAVTDASTAHLASLISKQKGTTKYSSASKKYGFRKTAVSKKSSSPCKNLDEKDKIIEDLRFTLEKERELNKNLYTERERLNSLIKVGQEALAIEQGKVTRLNEQLQVFKKNEERIEKSKEAHDPDVYIKAINSLKSKLLDQEEKNKVLLSKIKLLSNTSHSKTKDEKELLLLIKKEIDVLQKKQYSDCSVSKSLESINSAVSKRINTLKSSIISFESECKQDENSTSNSSKDDNNNNIYTNILNLYVEQREKIHILENQLEQQSNVMKSFTDKLEKRLQKMDCKINKQSQESAGVKNIISQLTGCLEKQILNQKETALPYIYCQPPEKENEENSFKEECSGISSVTTDSIVPETKRKRKRKKSKEVTQSKSVYVPPHRRT